MRPVTRPGERASGRMAAARLGGRDSGRDTGRDTGKRLLRERRLKRYIPQHPMRLLMLIAGAIFLVVVPGLVASNFIPGVRVFVIRESALVGFRVADVAVSGKHETPPADILKAVGVQRGDPILGVSLDAVRARLVTLPWVRSAVVKRRLPDTISVRLVERQPMALLRQGDRLVLLDTEGTIIATDDLARFGGLLEVVGTDAARHTRPLLDLIATEPVLAARVESAVWVEEARWNIHLSPGIEVKLPADPDARAAWHRLAAMERSERPVLESCATMIDLRQSAQMAVSCGTNVVSPAPLAPQAPRAKDPGTAKATAAKTTDTKATAGARTLRGPA